MMTIVAGPKQARGSWYGVHPLGHPVSLERAVERCAQAGAIHADVQIDGLGGLVQTVQVHFEEGDRAVMHTQPFPHAVTEYEPGIKHGHHGALARIERAVHVNENIAVTRIVRTVMRALSHRRVLT
jgi:hypothetical protein